MRTRYHSVYPYILSKYLPRTIDLIFGAVILYHLTCIAVLTCIGNIAVSPENLTSFSPAFVYIYTCIMFINDFETIEIDSFKTCQVI